MTSIVEPVEAEILLYTKDDTADMHRMGQVPQLRRSFRKFATISLITVLVATWEIIFLANNQGLVDGGLAGLFWSYVWTVIGFGLVCASLAEMASIAPTDGGMYHWVSEFAPAKYEKFLSYMTGWMSSLAWQAGNASGGFLAGTLVQAIVSLNDSSYVPKDWHGTLLVFAVVLIVWLACTYFMRFLPTLQIFLMVLHITSFVAITALLWARAPLASASDVFTTFSNSGGWSTTGLSVMVGQINVIYAAVGSDTAAHLAEETRDAGLAVPQAMMWSFGISAITGLIFLVTMLFTITSVDDALNDPSGYSAIWILRQVFPHSTGGITAVICILTFFIVASNISVTVSASRQMFAFARDRGLPFSSWISRVHPRLFIPFNAVTLSSVIACLLACINIGSSVAFNAIISLFLVALMATYAVAISCVLHRKYASTKGIDDHLPNARWLMPRKTGILVNVASVLYSVFACFWSFWPNSTSSDIEDLNWAPIIFGAVFILAVLMYFLGGRKKYISPVSRVINRGQR